jgi:hypothetical protein
MKAKKTPEPRLARQYVALGRLLPGTPLFSFDFLWSVQFPVTRKPGWRCRIVRRRKQVGGKKTKNSTSMMPENGTRRTRRVGAPLFQDCKTSTNAAC